MFSVYTSLFNYSPDKFDLIDAFTNWSKYAKKIVIATFPGQEDEILKAIWKDWYAGNLDKKKATIDVVCCETSLDDPLWDGKLKNASLQACKSDLVIQQDMDERIGGSVDEWNLYGKILLENSERYKAAMIPVIDLYKDYSHYKSIGYKWYLHLKKGCYRGPVNFAMIDESKFDPDKSDTCELVDKNGSIVPSFSIPYFVQRTNIEFPHIIHLGYLDVERRMNHNKNFWRGVWTERNKWKNKPEATEAFTNQEELDKVNIASIKHGFQEKWWQ